MRGSFGTILGKYCAGNISNGNTTDWSPILILPVIIKVITESNDRAAGV